MSSVIICNNQCVIVDNGDGITLTTQQTHHQHHHSVVVLVVVSMEIQNLLYHMIESYTLMLKQYT